MLTEGWKVARERVSAYDNVATSESPVCLHRRSEEQLDMLS